MGNQVLSGRINVPTVGPSPHTQRNFFSHKKPRHKGIKGHIAQELSSGKKETRCHKGDLRWPWLISIVASSNIDSHLVAQRGAPVLVVFVERHLGNLSVGGNLQ